MSPLPRHQEKINSEHMHAYEYHDASRIVLMIFAQTFHLLRYDTCRHSLIQRHRLKGDAVKRITGNSETSATIWQGTRRKTIRPIIQQFLFKTIHRTHLIGKYWTMATQEHPMARNQLRDNPWLWLYQYATNRTCEEQSATKEKGHAPRPHPTLPNPSIRIGVPDLGLEMRKSYTRKNNHGKRDQYKMAPCDKRKTHHR